MTVWYRLENGGESVFVTEYKVFKTTPKGVWVGYYGPERFVLLKAHKRFAYPTIEEATESFKRRKERQIGILEAQLDRARLALDAVRSGKYEYDIPTFELV